jgi:hypothetical protein
VEDDKAVQTLQEWCSRISRTKSFHYKYCATMFWWHKAFGILVILLSLASAVLSFFVLGKDSGGGSGAVSSCLSLTAGLAGTAALALATVQTFRAFDSEAESHRTSAKAYNALQAELEQAQASPPTDLARLPILEASGERLIKQRALSTPQWSAPLRVDRIKRQLCPSAGHVDSRTASG